MQKFVADESAVGMRLDIFLTKQFPEFSRSVLAKLFNHRVSVNGLHAKSSQKLKLHDLVEVDTALLDAEPEEIELPIIYEDKDVMVINKPSGTLTHSKGGLNLEGTVASFIKPKLNDENLTGERAGIVHRLDRATSGLIIAAKSQAASTYLQKQFSNRRVGKIYLAVVKGVIDPPEGVIDIPIARSTRNPKLFIGQSSGKQAITSYRVLKVFEENGKTLSLLELKPKTGRTHQLRVHLAHLGHPVVGDEFYRGFPAERLMLHASELEITLPSGVRKIFKLQPPKDFYGYKK